MRSALFNVLLAACIAAILWAIVRRVQTAELYGSNSREASKRFRALQWASDMWWVLSGISILTSAVLLAVVPLIGLLGRLEILAVGLIAVLIVVVVRVLRPPAVLFLASSSHTSRRLFHEIRRVAAYRVVTLLEPDTDGLGRLTYYTNGLRTRDPERWRDVVERLAEIVPVIVMDARASTPSVTYEAQFLLTSGLHRRSLFVAEPDGSLPALAPIGPLATQTHVDTVLTSQCADEVMQRLRTHARTVASKSAVLTLREALRLGLMGGTGSSASYLFAALAVLTLPVPGIGSYFGADQGLPSTAVPMVSHVLSLGTIPLLGIALARMARTTWWTGALIPWATALVPIPIALAFGAQLPSPDLTLLLIWYAALGAAVGRFLLGHHALALGLASVTAYLTALFGVFGLDLLGLRDAILAVSSPLAGAVVVEAVSQFLIWTIYGALMGVAVWATQRPFKCRSAA